MGSLEAGLWWCCVALTVGAMVGIAFEFGKVAERGHRLLRLRQHVPYCLPLKEER